MLSRFLLAVVVLAACGLTGCNPAGKLVGKWEADFSGVKSEAADTGNPLAAMAATMMSSVKLQSEFKSDGTCSVTGSFFGQANTTSGTWKYVKSEGDTLVLMVIMDKGSQERELRVKFIDNDTFEMAPPVETAGQAGKTLAFKRLKS
jgi:hypothetical protein